MATQVTVSGTLTDAEGANLTGTVTFRPTTPFVDSAGLRVIATAPVVATLSSGAFSVVLYATDDATTAPDGATYTVSENLTGADGKAIQRKFVCEIPSASATIRYETLVEVQSRPSYSYATLAYVQSLLDDFVFPPGSVTNARLADMAQSTIKGRAASSGTGQPGDLTPAEARTALAVPGNATTEAITGDWRHTGMLRWQGSAGGAQYVAKPLGSGAVSPFEIEYDDQEAYIFHVNTGPNSTNTSGGCFGIGVEHGGTGILLNIYRGRGLNIHNQAGNTPGAGFPINCNQNNANGVVMMDVVSNVPNASTYIRLRGNTTAADNTTPMLYAIGAVDDHALLARWDARTGGDLMEWYDQSGLIGRIHNGGVLDWRREIRSSNIVGSRETTSTPARAHLFATGNTAGLKVYRSAGGGLYYPFHITAESTSLKLQAGNSAGSAVGSETMNTIVELTGGATPKLGFFASTPVAKPTVNGSRSEMVGIRYVSLTSGTDSVTTPDAAPLDLTGDWTVIIDRDGDWTPGSDSVALGQWDATGDQRGVQVLVRTTGVIRVQVTTNGTSDTVTTLSTSAAVTLTDNTRGRLAVTRRASDGRVQVFTSTGTEADPAASTWTQVGTDLTGPTGTLHNSTAALHVGRNAAGSILAGDYYRAQVRTGDTIATSVLAADMWPDADKVTSTTMVASTGETWTLGGSAAWGGESAVKELLAALATMGLITNGSTA